MNIFRVSDHPGRSAMELGDRHVIKMVVETAQLLSTAHRMLDGMPTYTIHSMGSKKAIKLTYEFPNNCEKEAALYKVTHQNHPCSRWVRESSNNYQWAFEHFRELCNEYTYRYGKIHATQTKLLGLLAIVPDGYLMHNSTLAPCCVPEKYKILHSTIPMIYREYYINDKAHLHRYTRRSPPTWIPGNFVHDTKKDIYTR